MATFQEGICFIDCLGMIILLLMVVCLHGFCVCVGGGGDVSHGCVFLLAIH